MVSRDVICGGGGSRSSNRRGAVDALDGVRHFLYGEC